MQTIREVNVVFCTVSATVQIDYAGNVLGGYCEIWVKVCDLCFSYGPWMGLGHCRILCVKKTVDERRLKGEEKLRCHDIAMKKTIN